MPRILHTLFALLLGSAALYIGQAGWRWCAEGFGLHPFIALPCVFACIGAAAISHSLTQR